MFLGVGALHVRIASKQLQHLIQHKSERTLGTPRFPKKEKERMEKKERRKQRHTHTKRKTKGREAGKRKEPKEGRTKERTTNLEFNSLISR